MDTRLHLICNGARLDLAPIQGLWTQAQYLRLTDHSRQLLEFTDGRLETLPTPTRRHQAISRCLLLAWLPVVQAMGGELFYAPLRLRIREGKFREPDLLLRDAKDPRNQDDYWRGADVVAEIVSPRTIHSATPARSARTTPKRAFPSTGSSIPWTRR